MKVNRDGWNRDEFEDLYVRFMMFLDTLPRDVSYEKLFHVFMFYLDESRHRRSLLCNYTEAERVVYMKEQYELFRQNMDTGREHARMYKTDYVIPEPQPISQSQKVEIIRSQHNIPKHLPHNKYHSYRDNGFRDSRGYIVNDGRPQVVKNPQYVDAPNIRQYNSMKAVNTVVHGGPNAIHLQGRGVPVGQVKGGVAQAHYVRDGKEYVMRDGKEYLVVSQKSQRNTPRQNEYTTQSINQH